MNNSAYILFYQKRNGIYVGCSSNSSSAASTSSVGSCQDHWVSRMPRFIPPKFTTKQNEAKPAAKEDIFEERQHHVDVNEDEDETSKAAEEVALRNSQNTLHSSCNSVRKSVETKSTNTWPSEVAKNSPSLSQLSVNSINRTPVEPRKQIYTTSIYINSTGNLNVESTSNKSPVLSMHRVNGVAHDGQSVSLRENCVDKKNDVVYTTTAAIHRHSDIGYPAKVTEQPLRSQLNFVSTFSLNSIHFYMEK